MENFSFDGFKHCPVPGKIDESTALAGINEADLIVKINGLFGQVDPTGLGVKKLIVVDGLIFLIGAAETDNVT